MGLGEEAGEMHVIGTVGGRFSSSENLSVLLNLRSKILLSITIIEVLTLGWLTLK